MNYYIADCHFGHTKALEFDHRPFADTQEMEDAMVANWNATVKPGDIVYILGDFCMGHADEWLRIIRRLTGNKMLIQGNHDLKQYPPELRKQFADIKGYKEVKDYLNGEKRTVYLSHYPIMFYNHCKHESCYMLCGHVHISPENDLLEKWTAELKAARMDPDSHIVNRAQIYNVGCMMPWMAYTPRTLDQIVQGHDAYIARNEE